MVNKIFRKIYYRAHLLNKKYHIKKCMRILNNKYLDDYSDIAMKKKNKAMSFLCQKIDPSARIAGNVFVTAKLYIGKNVFIGRNFKVEGNGKVIIDDNCQISSNVTIVTGDHIIGESSRRAGTGYNNTIFIGKGTWVGNRVLILRNTTIGNGNVVAAGSVVIHSTPNDVLIAGVPAVIKKQLI